MDTVKIATGPFSFRADFNLQEAPNTCAWFQARLPYQSQVIHARWSGEAVWIPLADLETVLKLENHTAYPARGDILLYPGGISETEILFAYGSSQFASKMGMLAGNHFLTVTQGREQLAEFGKLVLWQGAQQIIFSTE